MAKFRRIWSHWLGRQVGRLPSFNFRRKLKTKRKKNLLPRRRSRRPRWPSRRWLTRTWRRAGRSGISKSLPILFKFCYSNNSGISLLKWANPSLFFGYFWSVQANITSFTSNQCEKMSKYTSSIWHRDSNTWPFKHELSPITPRLGLPPYNRGSHP